MGSEDHDEGSVRAPRHVSMCINHRCTMLRTVLHTPAAWQGCTTGCTAGVQTWLHGRAAQPSSLAGLYTPAARQGRTPQLCSAGATIHTLLPRYHQPCSTHLRMHRRANSLADHVLWCCGVAG